MQKNLLFVSIGPVLCLALSGAGFSQDSSSSFPADHKKLERPISYTEMAAYLEQVSKKDFVEVTVEGESKENRSLFLVHLCRGGEKGGWRVLLFGQQHGNEPAGKDALLYLIRRIADDPEQLPRGVDLWIMPMVNPDGAEANKRRNGNDADLNRDHQLLAQPETQTLHRLVRRIQPHVTVDCHEFDRTSSDFWDKGWLEWPLIMMDTANNPLFHPGLYEAGKRWCERIEPFMLKQGHNYCRYFLGGAPPDDELRHSAPEVDDARNGLGAYGGLSFIIESGIRRRAKDPNADLARRVGAYLDIFFSFLRNDASREGDRKAIALARSARVPDFLPINYFWGSAGLKITLVKVVDRESGKTLEIPTANFMRNLIIKKSVATPMGYLVALKHASLFQVLLDRHVIAYERLQEPATFTAESCLLVRTEDKRDRVYARYAGRQIVERKPPEKKNFAAGSLYIPLRQPAGLRAALLLEPTQLYGLFQYPEFREQVGEDKIVPVWRALRRE